MYILYLYIQTITHQCFSFPNSQWGVTAHDNGKSFRIMLVKRKKMSVGCCKTKHL